MNQQESRNAILSIGNKSFEKICKYLFILSSETAIALHTFQLEYRQARLKFYNLFYIPSPTLWQKHKLYR